MGGVDGGRRTLINVIVFLAAALSAGWIGRRLAAAVGEADLGLLVWLALPLLTSFALRALSGDGWRDLGLKPSLHFGRAGYLLAVLAYPACIGLVLLIGARAGWSTFGDNSDGLWRDFGRACLPLIGAGFAKNIAEEFAWRGYLAPKLTALRVPALPAHAIVGLAWGLWHLPFLAYVLSYAEGGVGLLLPGFLFGTVAVSLVYGEIRLRTDSVWPAVIMHTVGGTLIGALFMGGFVSLSPGREALASPGVEGWLGGGLFLLLGLGLLAIRKNRAARQRDRVEVVGSAPAPDGEDVEERRS